MSIVWQPADSVTSIRCASSAMPFSGNNKEDTLFIPSIYGSEIKKILKNKKETEKNKHVIPFYKIYTECLRSTKNKC